MCIRDRCDEAHLETKLNITEDFSEGDILEVVQGPFKGYDVEVISVSGDKILGQIDMFGRTVPAEFTKIKVYKKRQTKILTTNMRNTKFRFIPMNIMKRTSGTQNMMAKSATGTRDTRIDFWTITVIIILVLLNVRYSMNDS